RPAPRPDRPRSARSARAGAARRRVRHRFVGAERRRHQPRAAGARGGDRDPPLLADPRRGRRHARAPGAPARLGGAAGRRGGPLQRRARDPRNPRPPPRPHRGEDVRDPGPLLSLGGATPRPRWSFRLVASATLAVLALGVLAIELAIVQVADGPALAALARENSVHRIVLEAERGIIYDRHGTPLV